MGGKRWGAKKKPIVRRLQTIFNGQKNISILKVQQLFIQLLQFVYIFLHHHFLLVCPLTNCFFIYLLYSYFFISTISSPVLLERFWNLISWMHVNFFVNIFQLSEMGAGLKLQRRKTANHKTFKKSSVIRNFLRRKESHAVKTIRSLFSGGRIKNAVNHILRPDQKKNRISEGAAVKWTFCWRNRAIVWAKKWKKSKMWWIFLSTFP